MNKTAVTDYDVHPLIATRWSPRAFGTEPVSEEALRSILEAARWAPSAFNEQPWAFLVARRGDPEFDSLLACLNDRNRQWAAAAGAVIISMARTHFTMTGDPNRHAFHDVGLATATLAIQATALGLRVHPMSGFSLEEVRARFDVPDDFEPVAAMVVGSPGDPDTLPEDLREREVAPRTRSPQREFVFTSKFGEAR